MPNAVELVKASSRVSLISEDARVANTPDPISGSLLNGLSLSSTSSIPKITSAGCDGTRMSPTSSMNNTSSGSVGEPMPVSAGTTAVDAIPSNSILRINSGVPNAIFPVLSIFPTSEIANVIYASSAVG